jgi:hypothetical protein
MSYVTGSHNIKAGFDWARGVDRNEFDRQADLIQRYTNGAPQSVQIFNTPTSFKDTVKYDAGWYVQDTWTIKRLTLNPGVRFEYYNTGMEAISAPAGRFVPARFYPEEKNLPNWNNDIAPRFSMAYDLFGTGRTALKMSFSKYHANTGRSEFVQRYAAAGLLNEVRNWFDADLIPGTSTRSGIARPTDGDDIAQDNEIGPGDPRFGIRSPATFDPDIRRSSNRELTASVNHELMPRVAVSATFFRRTFHDLVSNDRVNITDADYTAFQVRMPDFSNDPSLAGVLNPNEMITIYNLNRAKLDVFADIRDRNGDNTATYLGYELSFIARLAGGATAYGGWTIERYTANYCDNNDNPNGGTVETEFERLVSNGGRFCDQGAFGGMPFQSDFKLASNMPLWYGVAFGVVFQNYPGTERVITWTPAASAFPGGRTQSQTIILSEPGSIYQPRYNQVDINVKKNFRRGTKVFTGQLDLFNVTNSASILETNDVIGSSLGGVQRILKGRMPRLSFQFRF